MPEIVVSRVIRKDCLVMVRIICWKIIYTLCPIKSAPSGKLLCYTFSDKKLFLIKSSSWPQTQSEMIIYQYLTFVYEVFPVSYCFMYCSLSVTYVLIDNIPHAVCQAGRISYKIIIIIDCSIFYSCFMMLVSQD